MKDERMQPLLDAWFRDRDESAQDASGDIARVMADVPQTRQQGQWWPLPTFGRSVSTFPVRALAPAPIPPTNGRQPARGFSMFSALKFVVAGVIVALFGGFLLAGVFTTPQEEEMAPAAVTESPDPSARTDILPGVELTVEEVEPGAYRVVNDGVRDLSKANNIRIVAGHDGGIYLLRPQRFLRLGDDKWHRWATKAGADDFEVAPDGTVWVSPLESFDGERWTTEKAVVGTTFDMTPDGTVWAFWEDPEREFGQPQVFAYLDEDGWQTLGHLEHVYDLLVAGPEDTWAMRWHEWPADLDLMRLVDGSWQRLVGIDGAEGQWRDAGSPATDDAMGLLPFGNLRIQGSAAIGPDGTLWAVTAPMESADLIRFDGSEWNRWSLLGTEYAPSPPYYLTRVAPDASLWVGLSHGIDGPTRTCHGVGHFDGVSWERYLPDRCVTAIDIAADGSVWLLAMQEGEDDKPLDAYVITPKAITASE